jgi:hypothetical protein
LAISLCGTKYLGGLKKPAHFSGLLKLIVDHNWGATAPFPPWKHFFWFLPGHEPGTIHLFHERTATMIVQNWVAKKWKSKILYQTTVEHAAKVPQMSRIREKSYCSCRAGAWYFHSVDSYAEVVFWIFLAHPLYLMQWHKTTNHNSAHNTYGNNHHDEVRENGIPYALGLTRSIAYRRNRLVNRKTAIIVSMTLHVGIK